VDVGEVLNEILFVLSAGCQWAAVPSDLQHYMVPVRIFFEHRCRWQLRATWIAGHCSASWLNAAT